MLNKLAFSITLTAKPSTSSKRMTNFGRGFGKLTHLKTDLTY